MSIPLPRLLREHRDREFRERIGPARSRWALRAWAFLARRPRLYQPLTALGMRILSTLGRRRGRLSRLPLASAWTHGRDLPSPQGETFMNAWRRRARTGGDKP